jgi:FeS assembly SUF system protein
MTDATTTTPLDDEDIEFVTPPKIQAPEDHPLWPKIRDQLRTVFDPEIPSNIFELGLIYKVAIADDNSVKVEMTLTSPGCPVAGTMPGMVDEAVRMIPGIAAVDVEIVWEPSWNPGMMAESARMALDMHY